MLKLLCFFLTAFPFEDNIKVQLKRLSEVCDETIVFSSAAEALPGGGESVKVYEKSNWNVHFYSNLKAPLKKIMPTLLRSDADIYLKIDTDTWIHPQNLREALEQLEEPLKGEASVTTGNKTWGADMFDGYFNLHSRKYLIYLAHHVENGYCDALEFFGGHNEGGCLDTKPKDVVIRPPEHHIFPLLDGASLIAQDSQLPPDTYRKLIESGETLCFDADDPDDIFETPLGLNCFSHKVFAIHGAPANEHVWMMYDKIKKIEL